MVDERAQFTPEDADAVLDEGEGSIDAGEGNDEGKEDKGAQDNDEGKEDKGAQGTTQHKGAQGTTQDQGAQGTSQDKDKWKPYVSVHVYGSPDEGTIERVAKYWPSPTTVIHIHSPNMSDPKAPSNVEFSSLGVYRGLPK